MGIFSSMGRIGGTVLSKMGRGSVGMVRNVAKVPLIKEVAKQTVVGAGLYAAGNALFGGGSSSSLPALPSGVAGGNLPAMGPGGGFANPIVGDRGLFQNDPNIAAALQPWAISKANLRLSFRSPIKGFVVVRDSAGDPYALPKVLARKYAGWKPSKKPPVSAGEWAGIQRADRTVKKVRKVLATMTRVDKAVGKGGKVKINKKGGR